MSPWIGHLAFGYPTSGKGRKALGGRPAQVLGSHRSRRVPEAVQRTDAGLDEWEKELIPGPVEGAMPAAAPPEVGPDRPTSPVNFSNDISELPY